MEERKRMGKYEYYDDGPIWVRYPPGTFNKPLSPEKERILRAIEIQELRELMKRHPPRPNT
jgi:hypothetical protein